MVLIKGMDMPESCEACELSDIICLVLRKGISRDIGELRPRWCPLTDVEPYGAVGTLYKEK